MDVSCTESDAHICFPLFAVSGSSFSAVITWSHLASVVTKEWKQLSHRLEQGFQLLPLCFFFFVSYHISFGPQEAHLTLVLFSVRQKTRLLSWNNEEKKGAV